MAAAESCQTWRGAALAGRPKPTFDVGIGAKLSDFNQDRLSRGAGRKLGGFRFPLSNALF